MSHFTSPAFSEKLHPWQHICLCIYYSYRAIHNKSWLLIPHVTSHYNIPATEAKHSHTTLTHDTHTHTHMFVKTSEWRPLWETAEWRPGQLPLNIEAKCSYSAYGFLEPRKPRLHDFQMRRLNESKSAKYSGVTAGGYDVTMTSLYFTHPKWRPVVTSRCTGLHTPHLAFAARINIPIV